MKKNKYFIILITILVILVSVIVLLLINIKNKATFTKPDFEPNISTEIPDSIDYKSSTIHIRDNYSVYIDGIPIIENDYLIINFISLADNNIWIKLRILNEDEKIVAESGLIKPGEYLKSIKTTKKISKNENIKYMIIGYEIDSYLSAGTVELNTKVGD